MCNSYAWNWIFPPNESFTDHGWAENTGTGQLVHFHLAWPCEHFGCLAFLMKWSLMKQAVNLIDTFKQLLCNWALSNKASAKLATKTKGKVPEQLQGQGLLDLGHQTGLSSQLLAPGMGPQSTWGLEVHQRPGKCMGNTKAYCGAWYLNCCCSRHCPG